MAIKYYFSVSLIVCYVSILCSCREKPKEKLTTNFTKADSLTDTYLDLQDSMVRIWNIMINDDNQKIEAMQKLVQTLKTLNTIDPTILASYEERISQLKGSRYTQESMANADVVEEYDFASNALVSELISLTESQTQFAYNTTLQRLVDDIRAADQRVNNYRTEYDEIAAAYNNFVEKNKNFLKELSIDSVVEKKPLFQIATDDTFN
jgi:hypothetical protein